ncbi:hypothetical protein EZV61_10285 [Corallincola luteus]|uniref:FAD-binding oxidoreductase n=1 Tax=Corallincola luteus TaxID=1775177 RepID=A0ABY2AM13_9GAMM|nr:hypothetical protein [Corallincola luteus]TCI03260.1 hypothetical protein EZV61_10285 [Corallincola luteus]
MRLVRYLLSASQVIALLVLLLPNGFANTIELKPFTTDGCSLFPDGTLMQRTLWLACCESHDIAYWMGGTSKQRVEADLALKQCVADIGEPMVAELMLNGVRIGGTPFLPTQFRWGYGWPYPRGYEPLTAKEKQEASQLLRTFMQLKDSNKKVN